MEQWPKVLMQCELDKLHAKGHELLNLEEGLATCSFLKAAHPK
jgi:hypothetical protein